MGKRQILHGLSIRSGGRGSVRRTRPHLHGLRHGEYRLRLEHKRDDRPGLETCLKALRSGDTLVVWKLDRLGRDLAHLVAVVSALADREVGLRVLAGPGAAIDTTTASGRLVFGIFAALAELSAN